MKILKGTCSLYDFFEIVKTNENLMKKYDNFIHESKCFKKITDEFINNLFSMPFIFYLENNSFANNSETVEINEIIHYINMIEKHYIFTFLNNLSPLKQRAYTFKFIAIQVNQEKGLSNQDIFNTSILKEIIFLDSILIKESTNGKINFNKIENNLKKYIINEKLKQYIKNFQGNVFQHLFTLQPKKSKRIYTKKEFKFIENFEVEYNSIDKNKFFLIECPFCRKKHCVSIEKGKNSLIPEDIFEIKTYNSKKRVILKCDHKNTHFYGNIIEFSFAPKFNLDNENKYIYALLEYFYQFNVENNNLIFFNDKNQKQSMLIEDVIQKIKELNVQK